MNDSDGMAALMHISFAAQHINAANKPLGQGVEYVRQKLTEGVVSSFNALLLLESREKIQQLLERLTALSQPEPPTPDLGGAA